MEENRRSPAQIRKSSPWNNGKNSLRFAIHPRSQIEPKTAQSFIFFLIANVSLVKTSSVDAEIGLNQAKTKKGGKES